MFKNSIIIAIVAIVIGTFSTTSKAQRPIPGPMGGGLLNSGGNATTELVNNDSGNVYGRVTAFDGSHFELNVYQDGSQIKTFRDGCQDTADRSGTYCPFGHFVGGRLAFSGWALVNRDATVYLRWTNMQVNNQSTPIDTGWIAYRPR